MPEGAVLGRHEWSCNGVLAVIVAVEGGASDWSAYGGGSNARSILAAQEEVQRNGDKLDEKTARESA